MPTRVWKSLSTAKVSASRSCPTYCFDLTDALVPGENRIRIEAATTLERENYKIPHRMGLPKPEPKDPSGINGEVHLYLI